MNAAPKNQPCVAQQEMKSCTNDSAPYRLSDQATLGGASSRGVWLVTFNGLLKFPLNLANQSLWAGYSATSNDWPFCWPLWTGSSWCANWQLGHLQLHFLWWSTHFLHPMNDVKQCIQQGRSKRSGRSGHGLTVFQAESSFFNIEMQHF